MCTIQGGTSTHTSCMSYLKDSGVDRGRDGENMEYNSKGYWVRSFRATPTTEVEEPERNQPFYLPKWNAWVVHNGTISNDKELGNSPSSIDSEVLTKILDLSSFRAFRDSLQKIKGSYAIIVMRPDKFYLACNYKPLWILHYKDNFYFSSMKRHFDFLPASNFLYNIRKLEPYTCMQVTSPGSSVITLPLPRKQYDKCLIIASGGLDSTAVAAYADKQHAEMTLLHFDYGCHAGRKEMECIKKLADYFECGYKIMPLSYKGMANSSLLGKEKEITLQETGAEYAYEWVPARNLVMLSLAVAYAEANNYGHIYIGINLEEGGAYPDNEEQFILDYNACLYGAVQNGVKIEIHSPIGNLMKHEIILFGKKYGAPFGITWSCYKDGDKPCGECGPDFMRRKAFERNGLKDPLDYK